MADKERKYFVDFFVCHITMLHTISQHVVRHVAKHVVQVLPTIKLANHIVETNSLT